jgi:hypothetical protein
MFRAFNSGVAGALAVTAVHECVRRQTSKAPRMDVLGERAIAQTSEALFGMRPHGKHLHEAALAGDLAANSAYYSLVGLGRPEGAVARGAALGLAAGIGALALPGPLGLGSKPSNRTLETQVMTVAWYVIGGLTAGLMYRALSR